MFQKRNTETLSLEESQKNDLITHENMFTILHQQNIF